MGVGAGYIKAHLWPQKQEILFYYTPTTRPTFEVSETLVHIPYIMMLSSLVDRYCCRLLWRNVAASIFREEVGVTVFLLRLIHTYHAMLLRV